MITCQVTRLAETIDTISLNGHASNEDAIGVRVCASISGIVGVSRELLGGSPLKPQSEGGTGGAYFVKVLPNRESQERAEGILRVFKKLEDTLLREGASTIFEVQDG